MSAIDQPGPVAKLSEAQTGVVLCILAHLVWGGMALYFGLIRHISPVEIAVNRGLWALPIAGLVILAFGYGSNLRAALAQPKLLATLALTSFLIVFNWGFYVWSIQAGRTVEASLGYFINPLMNVVAGYFFLGERFTKAQSLAIVLAALGVLIQTIATGVVPWLGLMLGATFCLYGFIRKTVQVGAIEGFFIETLLIAPPLLAAEAWLFWNREAYFGTSVFDTLMLMGCGLLTAAALMLFALAIRRIRYSTAGLMQYISPSLVFLTAIFVFHEHMDGWKLLSFAVIWLALAIYSIAALREDRQRRLALSAEPNVF
jgi:chloramphenicol-sensitive protein RarD